MALLVLRMSGQIYNSNTAGTPYEIWSCSLSLSQTGALDLPALSAAAATLCQTWFEDEDTGIDATCGLENVALNQVDVSTGLQITDPTIDVAISPGASRGGLTPTVRQVPTASYRVSLDDGTRNRRAKGGFYVPRVGFEVQANGRLSPTDVAAAATSAQTLINGLSALTGCNVVVWSRRDEALHGVTRLRVGDVMDNISRRRDALVEAYETRVITP